MIKTMTFGVLLWASSLTWGYGDLGHKMVAAAAWPQLTPYAKHQVESILGFGQEKFVKASVWADHIKSDQRFNHLKPLHYVNLPKGAKQYKKQRDCKDGQCIVQAIHDFSEYARSGSEREQVLALRMLIHLIADIHQPLHAGYEKDRGGNWFEVKYQDYSVSLHKLWDHQLVERFHEDWQEGSAELLKDMPKANLYGPEKWAEISHALVERTVYQTKENRAVSKVYLDMADDLTRRQLQLAAWRLAMWLNQLW